MSPHRRRTDQPASRRSRRTVAVVSVLAAVAVAAAFAAAGTALWLNAGRTDEVAQLAQQIQDERAANVRRNCEDVNARHDRTIAQLHALVAAIPDPDRKARAEANIAGTIALIDALTPKRDCRALVAQQVDTK